MVLEKVIELLADYSDVDAESITAQSTFDELGLDSLDTVELMMGIEDEFGVAIEVSDSIKTIGDVVDYIENNQ